MQTVITIVRYPKWWGWIGFQSMAVFHLPLLLNKNISFYKLLGTGKNGTFDKTPDWSQWGVLVVLKKDLQGLSSDAVIKHAYGTLITRWWKCFNVKKQTLVLEPIEGHGLWDGKEVFGTLPRTTIYDGKIAVLTRATLRLNRVKQFWRNVVPVAKKMAGAKGLITSIGIGEVPWIKQATLSIWEDKESMKAFAYQMQEHQEVIQKTRKENWYTEELFVRFKILASWKDPHPDSPCKGEEEKR